jgi:hypothetical protein
MRFLLYLIVGVIVLSLLRSVLEAIGKTFSGGQAASQPSAPAASSGGDSRGQAPQSLKKDPVCGTFVSAATAVLKSKGGETYYFCSAECRDKF